MNSQADRLPSLDGLRAISIALVVTCHLAQTLDFTNELWGFRDAVIRIGPLGVRVFFVISGFLITNILLRELDEKNRINLTRFYLRRTLRILVPYYLLILVVLVLQSLNKIELGAGDLLHALSYTMNYHAERTWYLGHAWSLSVEEQFYLLWPAVLLLMGKRRGLLAATFLLLLCPLIRLAYFNLYPSLVEEEIGYRFETVADALACGCVLAAIFGWLKVQSSFNRVITSRMFTIVPVVVLIAGLVDQSLWFSLLLGISIQNLGVAACIVWGLTNHSGKIGRLLNCKPVVFVGVMSYSIYLWQQLFLNPYSSSAVSSFPLNLALVGAVSLASYYLIERTSLEMRRRLEARITPALWPSEAS